MRIDSLHLEAVGPFTDRRVDLSAGDSGVHVIYGPNEAGKSSSLRAVHALLFGFHPRTPDNFLHPYSRLRVGAVLRARDGTRLTCYRRKGSRDTLRDEQDRPLADDALAALLGGVDEALFGRLFGIDHATLVEGGAMLMAQHGQEAEALFGSGLGSNAVHRVRVALDDEADALFTASARKKPINALLTELNAARKAESEASLSAASWETARQCVETTRADLDAADRELAAAQARRTALERLRRTLPLLARRRALLEQLGQLGEPPLLALDFAQRRQDAVQAERSALERATAAGARLAALEQDMRALSPQPAILREHDTIEDLRDRLQVHRKAERDRPGLTARKEQIARELEQQRARPGLETADAPAAARLLTLQRRADELAARKEARESALGDLRRRLDVHREDLARAGAALAALPAPADRGALRDAVKAARGSGDLDAQVEALAADAARRARECRDRLHALGRFAGDLDALAAAPLPDDAALADFARRFGDLDARAQRIARERDQARADRDSAAQALAALDAGGDVPSPASLEQTRRGRDAAWSLLRARWVDGRDVDEDAQRIAPGMLLHDAFEQSVREADMLADTLLRDAQRVHQHARHRTDLDAAAARLSQLEQDAVGLEAERGALEAAWRAAWQPSAVEPAAPPEMQSWLAKVERLREQWSEARAASDRQQGAERGREQVRALLLAAMGGAAGDGARMLAPVLARAERLLSEADDTERERRSLQHTLAACERAGQTLRTEHDAAALAMEQWRGAWDALVSELGIPAAASPGEVADFFAAVRAIAVLCREQAELETRLAGIASDAQRFIADARAVCGRVAPDLDTTDIAEAVLALHQRLREQHDASTRLGALRAQAEAARRDRDQAKALGRAAARVIDGLCREAGGVEPAELEAVQRRDASWRIARDDLTVIERDLQSQGDGASVEALAAAASGVDVDAAGAELDQLLRHISDDLEPRRRALSERKVNAERDFADMAGDAGAASHAERAQQLLAQLRSAVGRYMRLRLAARALSVELERFRAENRDPILTAASGYLDTMTAGAYVAVDTDFDDAGQPVLSAVRPDRTRLRVDSLSDGTCDQLYLALRLAALDHFLRRSEPMPFIVDDILVQFDDLRSRAALEALAQFSRRTQVLVFTHHKQVVVDARALAGTGGGVFVHELERAGG